MIFTKLAIIACSPPSNNEKTRNVQDSEGWLCLELLDDKFGPVKKERLHHVMTSLGALAVNATFGIPSEYQVEHQKYKIMLY